MNLRNKSDLYSDISILRDFGYAFIPILYIDADLLKDINLRYGRTQGDIFIDKLDRNIYTRFSTDNSIVYKYGGDEYIVIYKYTNDLNIFLKKDSSFKLYDSQELDLLNTENYTILGGLVAIKTNEIFQNEISRYDYLLFEKKQVKYTRFIKALYRNYLEIPNSLFKRIPNLSNIITIINDSYSVGDCDWLAIYNKVIDYNTALDCSTGIYSYSSFKKMYLELRKIYSYGLYFDMDYIKDLSIRYGRETCSVPLMNLTFGILNRICKQFSGSIIYRLGGDEGIILFRKSREVTKFIDLYGSISKEDFYSAYSSGVFEGENLIDRSCNYHLSLPKKVLENFLQDTRIPIRITWVIAPLQEYPSINDYLDFCEKSSNEIKIDKYKRLKNTEEIQSIRKLV